MESLAVIFFVIACGSGFTLRGIWGHQIGGGAMGIIVGLALSLILELPLDQGMSLIFWLEIAWAIGSFIGWANFTSFKRGLRGYFAYAAFPNLVMGIILFGFQQIIPLAMLTFVGSLGMGIGFAASDPLLRITRANFDRRYKEKHPDSPKITYVEYDRSSPEKEICYVEIARFNTWKILLEISSGVLYGLSTILILAFYEADINIVLPINGQNIDFMTYFYAAVSLVVLWMLFFISVFDFKMRYNGFVQEEHQSMWSKEKSRKFILVTLICGMVYGIILLGGIDNIQWRPIFLFIYWSIFISSRFRHHLKSLIFKVDLIVDLCLGIVITLCAFFI